MATALKDIQFSSPVLNGTTANDKTTWTYGENDVVVFGCGSSGVDYSEMHYGSEDHCGSEYHGGSVTFGSCGYEDHYGSETHCGYEDHYGSETHGGYEEHWGCEYHYGSETHNGTVTFTSCGCEYHYGSETHNGTVTFTSCGYEDHYGMEYHCGIEYHNGWVEFYGSCSCASDGFIGTNILVGGIAVVDPTDHSQYVLLTYSELKAHGF